jgi:hypothetical protein
VTLLLAASATPNAKNVDFVTPVAVAKTQYVVRELLCSVAGSPCTCPAMSSQSFVADVFWSAMGLGQDNHLFECFGVYPFDRLTDPERIVVMHNVLSGFSCSEKGHNYDKVFLFVF